METVLRIFTTTLLQSRGDELARFARESYATKGRGIVWLNIARLRSNLIDYMPLTDARKALQHARLKNDVESLGFKGTDLLKRMRAYDPDSSMLIAIIPDAKVLRGFDFGVEIPDGDEVKLPGYIQRVDFGSQCLN